MGGGGIGATLYASHCFDDSPLFVLVWYSLAIALVTAVGFFAGRHLLRW
ncbi:MAG: NrsF family protein [Pseudomonadota bacterium]